MVKTKPKYILATFFLSGAAAILSLVALGSEEWVRADADAPTKYADEFNNFIQFGLFTGSFHQEYIQVLDINLKVVCRFDLNICALLCGDDMGDNLGKLYKGEEDDETEKDQQSCYPKPDRSYSLKSIPRAVDIQQDRIFINSGVWLCTILFLIISAIFGLFSAALAVWNTVASPYIVFFSVFGLYIYNLIAFVSILLAVILWGAMFADSLTTNVPCYKTLTENYSTKGNAELGYPYWILLISVFFYLISISLLLVRTFLMSKEPKVDVHLKDGADPVIYLY